MKFFVLGASHTGKTPFAQRLADHLGIPRVGASALVRARFPAGSPVEEMTAFATATLRADPMHSADALRAAIAHAGAHCVVEGVRNPTDFIATFDPRCDRVVILARAASPVRTAFEHGLDVIAANARLYSQYRAD